MGKKIEIKKLPDFEAMLNAGNTTYTGLVEAIGYVYWTTETLYFIRINPEERWAIPKYRQIPFPYFQRKDAIIETKTLHTLRVLPKIQLMKHDFDAYYAFYGALDEMMKLIQPTDVIKKDKAMPLPLIKAKGAEQGNDKKNGILSLGSQINNQIGSPLDAVNMVMDNKQIGKIGDGLSLISIIDDVNKGEYWSAAGDALLFAAGKTKLSPYLTAISLGTWMYHTDLMQRRLAESHAKEYKSLERKLKRNITLNEKAKIKKEMAYHWNEFKKCVDYLEIPY